MRPDLMDTVQCDYCGTWYDHRLDGCPACDLPITDPYWIAPPCREALVTAQDLHHLFELASTPRSHGT